MQKNRFILPVVLGLGIMTGCYGGGAVRPEKTPAAKSRTATVARDKSAEEGAAPAAPVTTESPEVAHPAAPAPGAAGGSPATGASSGSIDFSDVTITGDLSRPEGAAEAELKKAPPPARAGSRPRPASAGVKAGSADDNLQFGAFLDFLAENGRLGLPCDVSHRVVVQVLDRDERPIPDAAVTVRDGGRVLLRRRSYADGRALVFPSESPELRSQGARLVIEVGQARRSLPLAGDQLKRRVKFDFARPRVEPVPLDIAFVLDTTGSMGDEIARLKQTIEYIHFQITNFTPRPDVRFGMVLYRDRGDEYRTRLVPFTADVQAFVKRLAAVRAGGGGDTPEDVQEALRRALWDLQWRSRGVRLAFLIGDAPPHLDYGQQTTYVDAMRRAAELGVKIATIGASGLDRKGELVWRQLAQYTMAPFVFLTYGESGDSEGSPSSVSHHVGSNWVAENLDAIVVRLVKQELGYYGSRVVEPPQDYFLADASGPQAPDQVLDDLFQQAVRQLIDYCLRRIEPATPTVVLPWQVDAQVSRLASRAGKQLQDRLALGLVRSGRFQLVEREDLPRVLSAAAEQFSHKYDAAKMVELGKLVPARLAVLASLGPGAADRLELLIKLVRLQTGEILSLSLLKIDRRLLAR